MYIFFNKIANNNTISRKNELESSKRNSFFDIQLTNFKNQSKNIEAKISLNFLNNNLNSIVAGTNRTNRENKFIDFSFYNDILSNKKTIQKTLLEDLDSKKKCFNKKQA